MTNKKSTKKALLTSTLCLLLCMSMLVGTTFAWFTDSVESLNNKIVAGNLDVELYNALKDNLTDDTKVKDGGLFEEITYWEPGVVAYENLTIANEGTLALKYALSVNFDNENTLNGYDLSDKLQVAFVPGGLANGTSREKVLEAADKAGFELMASFAQNGKLLPAEHDHITEIDKTGIPVETVSYAIVIYWEPSDDDNNWNANNNQDTSDGKALHIDLGVNLFATQMVAEDDSFGTDYDEEAEYVIGAGQSSSYVGATIDGTVANYGNVTISGGSISQEGNQAFYNEGKAELKDVDLTMTGINGYITNSRGDDSVTIFENVDATSSGGGVNVWEGEAIFKSGTITTNNITSSPRHVFYVAAGGKLIIEEGTFTFSPSNLTRRGSYLCADGENAVIIVEGGTFGKASTKTAPVQAVNGGKVIIRGGTFAWNPTNWVDTGYKAEKVGDNWVVGPKATDSASLKDAIEAGEKEIAIGAGTYTFPASSLSGDQTLICAPGTVFEGAKLNANGATVIGATFSGTASSNTVNGIYKDCTFTGSNGLRYGYVGTTAIFENCVFSGNTYGVHFDGGANAVLFKNCTISGFNATAAAVTKVTFEGCTFVGNGKSSYNGINLWGDGDFKDCTFVFDGSSAYEWIDLCSGDKTANFENCVVSDGTTTSNVSTLIGDKLTKRQDSGKIIVDGVELTY